MTRLPVWGESVALPTGTVMSALSVAQAHVATPSIVMGARIREVGFIWMGKWRGNSNNGVMAIWSKVLGIIVKSSQNTPKGSHGSHN